MTNAIDTWPATIYLGDFYPADRLYDFSELNTEIGWTAKIPLGEVFVEYVRKDLVKEMK